MSRFDPGQPFNDLPPLPPAVELETPRVLKACIEARASLAALKQAGEVIPNQAVLINTIPLLEAQASSEIENIVTTSDKLFRHAQLVTAATDPATKEALRYRTAIQAGFRALDDRPINTSIAVDVCRIIKNQDIDIRRVPGTALTNTGNGETVYTPPVGESLLRDKLSNWERFMHEHEEIDPLVRMAAAHYQFEAIHPFVDGNGRTGRILNLLFLVDKGLLKLPVLYLSGYFIKNRADYYRLLLKVTTDEAWEEWLLYVLQGVREESEWTREKIQAIRRLMDHTTEHVREALPAIYSRELVEQLFIQPYCRINDLVDAGIAKRQTASSYLHSLCEHDVLGELKVGREKLFVHPKFLDLVTSERNEFGSY